MPCFSPISGTYLKAPSPQLKTPSPHEISSKLCNFPQKNDFTLEIFFPQMRKFHAIFHHGKERPLPQFQRRNPHVTLPWKIFFPIVDLPQSMLIFPKIRKAKLHTIFPHKNARPLPQIQKTLWFILVIIRKIFTMEPMLDFFYSWTDSNEISSQILSKNLKKSV